MKFLIATILTLIFSFQVLADHTDLTNIERDQVSVNINGQIYFCSSRPGPGPGPGPGNFLQLIPGKYTHSGSSSLCPQFVTPKKNEEGKLVGLHVRYLSPCSGGAEYACDNGGTCLSGRNNLTIITRTKYSFVNSNGDSSIFNLVEE